MQVQLEHIDWVKEKYFYKFTELTIRQFLNFDLEKEYKWPYMNVFLASYKAIGQWNMDNHLVEEEEPESYTFDNLLEELDWET